MNPPTPHSPDFPGAAPRPSGPAEALIAILLEQAELYAGYREVAARQRLAIINRDLVDSQKINEESAAFATQTLRLEKRRLMLTAELMGILALEDLGLHPRDVRCEMLASRLEPELSGRLLEARKLLAGQLQEVGKALKLNAVLVENGRRIIHATVGIITSVAGRKEGDQPQLYSSRGTTESRRPQIRQLVNCKV